MMSAAGAEADIRQGLAAGADDYLTKPLRPADAAARIKAAVAQRSSPRRPASRSRSGPPVPAGVLAHLLTSAVALQAESLLRAAGALSSVCNGTPDRTEWIETGWIERDARDFSALATAAVAVGARPPAGGDIGAADPGRPHTAAESMLAGHQALIRVLREIADADVSQDVRETAPPWRRVVLDLLHRKERETELLRAVGAQGDLPPEPVYHRGVPPRP